MPIEHLAAMLALVGIVILVSSLLSGAVERSGVPQVAIFLALGATLGPAGLGLVEFTLESPTLQLLATLGLMLVLFTDAIGVDIGEVRRHRRLALLVLGPGTLLPAALTAVAAWLLLGLGPGAALILGAALASTDPVLLRTLLHGTGLPAPARLALRLESGMNDVVLLPVVALAVLALRSGGAADAGEVGRHVVGLFLLGPALGAVVGYVGTTLLDQVRRRVGVRRDYESLYALGVALTAFAAAEGVGGSGFLAAFAAGLTIAALDVEMCDCFLDYGQATAEMFLLLTFVAFGASLIWGGVPMAADWRVLLFAVVALVVRTGVLLPVLARAGVEPESRRIIAWAGPRGLSSLLLVLIPVFAGVPGAEYLFSITCLVVLLSVVAHGTGIALFLRKHAARGAAEAAPPSPGEPPAPAEPAAAPAGEPPERITVGELRGLLAAGAPTVVTDVRTERAYGADSLRAAGAVRVRPDDAIRDARALRLSQRATLVLYCA